MFGIKRLKTKIKCLELEQDSLKFRVSQLEEVTYSLLKCFTMTEKKEKKEMGAMSFTFNGTDNVYPMLCEELTKEYKLKRSAIEEEVEETYFPSSELVKDMIANPEKYNKPKKKTKGKK